MFNNRVYSYFNLFKIYNLETTYYLAIHNIIILINQSLLYKFIFHANTILFIAVF